MIEAQQIDRVIIAFSRASHEQLLETIRACRDAGVTVDVVPRLFEFLDGVRALDQVGGCPCSLSGRRRLPRPRWPRSGCSTSSAPGPADRVFSPVMLAIAIAIKLESRGPVFFRQPRAGRGNSASRDQVPLDVRRRGGAEARDRPELNEASDGVMFKIRRDPRVTE